MDAKQPAITSKTAQTQSISTAWRGFLMACISSYTQPFPVPADLQAGNTEKYNEVFLMSFDERTKEKLLSMDKQKSSGADIKNIRRSRRR